MHQRRELGLVEAISLSIAILSPTISLSFNTVFTVKAAGAGAPLSFLVGTVSMLIVGLCFVAFERRIQGFGSVYSYVRHAFGGRWGYVAGWTLLLFYAGLAASALGLVGNGFTVLLDDAGVHHPELWMPVGVATLGIATWLCWQDTKVAVRGMLALEGVSVLIIVILVVRIMTRVPLSWAPLHPDAAHGWSGIGYAMIFTTLAFGGFEGAAAFSQETRDPKRNIPLALIGTVTIAAGFYVLVMYAQVVGYGVGNMDALAGSDSPLSTLATRFISRQYALCIDVAVTCSAFACVMGALSAAARMLQALSMQNERGWFAKLDGKHSTPRKALVAISLCCLIAMLAWGPHAGVMPFAIAAATIGSLALILVYLCVCVAEMVESARSRRPLWLVLSVVGALLLLWPLWNNLYPVPNFPDRLWPYIVGAWVLAGAVWAQWIYTKTKDSVSATP